MLSTTEVKLNYSVKKNKQTNKQKTASIHLLTVDNTLDVLGCHSKKPYERRKISLQILKIYNLTFFSKQFCEASQKILRTVL